MNHFHGVYEDHPVKLDPGKPFFAIGKMFKPQIGDAVVELATDLKSVYRLVWTKQQKIGLLMIRALILTLSLTGAG